MGNTSAQYDEAVAACRDIFIKKMQDYGSAWRILRSSSITDQLWIKGKRIRKLEETGERKVDEGVEPEYRAIVNYSVMALIQLTEGYTYEMVPDKEKLISQYDQIISKAKLLMGNKNHDYDEAWREMRTTSHTDMILQKLLRIKEIEQNKGKTLISEGIDANYLDIINYALFALIQLGEGNE
jgi:hypothetical protein